MNQIKPIITALFCLVGIFAFAQKGNVEGYIVKANTTNTIHKAIVIADDGSQGITDAKGYFKFELEAGERTITIELDGYTKFSKSIKISPNQTESLGTLGMEPTATTALDENLDRIPVIALSAADLDDDTESQDISGLLTASRDVFLNAAAYSLGPLRFRVRGYDSELTKTFLNGMPMNDIESGRVFWGAWGGLNDVTRARENHFGLSPNSLSFGGIAGSVGVDTRASSQRKQIRASYAVSNRSYTNRVMLTYASGQLKNGWSVALSGSRRWAQEGYEPGTFYDGWSYFASVDKKLGDKHALNFTLLGTPTKRGGRTATVNELVSLTGDTYYNPFWGYQEGKKRNARVSNTHQPIGILRHDWKVNEKTNITTSAGIQTGRNGRTSLDWIDAPDPRPEYYRNLPSFIQDETLRDQLTTLYQNNPELLQINWTSIYNVNQNSNGDALAMDGGVIQSGKIARYMLADRRYDTQNITFNTMIESSITDRFSMQGGLSYQSGTKHNFQVLDDLLGADFHWDIDRFATRNFPSDRSKWQSDLNNPDRIVGVGDTYGYDYNLNINRGDAWVQAQLNLSNVDAFLALNLNSTSFWRTGNFKSGLFPDNSFGDSELTNFLTYGVKGGLTYKIDGRNYLYANGGMGTMAPSLRNVFQAPRRRDQLVEGLETIEYLTAEGGYLLKSPNFKARISAYYTTMKNQTDNISFFIEDLLVGDIFGNYIVNGIDQQHAGIELGFETKIGAGFSVNAAAALGQYIYTARPTASIYIDNVAQLVDQYQIYEKNFYVPGTPQQAGSFTLRYNSPKFWYANLTANYISKRWLDFNPDRRTTRAIAYPDGSFVQPGTELWESIIHQEEAPAAFTLDFFGGKSWKVKEYFVYLNVGVNNILNNQEMITGGYEQLRFDTEEKDPNRFPTRYFRGIGMNYFINLSVKL